MRWSTRGPSSSSSIHGNWKSHLANTALTAAGAFVGVGLIIFASSALVVVLIGGAVFYLVRRSSRRSFYQSMSNQVRKTAPHTPSGTYKDSMAFPSLVPSIFGMLVGVMQQSTGHARDIERIIQKNIRTNPNIVKALGPTPTVSTCRKIQETTINGRGMIFAEFPIHGSKIRKGFVKAEAEISPKGPLKITKLEAHLAGKTTDLLTSDTKGPIIDAEFRNIS